MCHGEDMRDKRLDQRLGDDRQSPRLNGRVSTPPPREKQRPKYHEPAYVDVYHSDASKGYAFGTMRLDGKEVEVFIGSKAHSELDAATRRWSRLPPYTPEIGARLEAKVCLNVEAGKKPFAAFWRYEREMFTEQAVEDGFWADDKEDEQATRRSRNMQEDEQSGGISANRYGSRFSFLYPASEKL